MSTPRVRFKQLPFQLATCSLSPAVLFWHVSIEARACHIFVAFDGGKFFCPRIQVSLGQQVSCHRRQATINFINMCQDCCMQHLACDKIPLHAWWALLFLFQMPLHTFYVIIQKVSKVLKQLEFSSPGPQMKTAQKKRYV